MADEKIDRLFLKSNCFDCGKVRGEIDFDAVVDDDFKGKNDQELRVYTALSKQAALELLEKFDIGDKTMPVIVTYDGAVIEKTKNVIMHLRRSGMVKE